MQVNTIELRQLQRIHNGLAAFIASKKCIPPFSHEYQLQQCLSEVSELLEYVKVDDN
jgi:hypothetical protein